MTRIVTTHYRYKRPPPKRMRGPAALEVPAIARKSDAVAPPDRVETTALSTIKSKMARPPGIVTTGKGRAGNDNREAGVPTPEQTGRSTIVRAKPRLRSAFGDAPDMTPEEHQRRGDASVALWRELVAAAAKRRRED